MQLTVNREQAMKAVGVARQFAAGASGQDVLQGVRVCAEGGRVRLTTTDLEVWCQVDVDAQTAEPGTMLVPARGLETVLKNLPQSRVALRRAGDELVCEAGSSEVRLAGLDTEEYPDVEEPEGLLLSMPLPAGLVDRVAYAVSRDETRYTLTGVLLEVEGRRLKLVATDGHRLARYVGSLPPGSACEGGEEPVRAIVPVRLLQQGVRLGGMSGGRSGSKAGGASGGKAGGAATFELYEKVAAVRLNGSARIWSGCIEGRYPEYEGTVPSDYTATVVVPKGTLSSAVSRLGALSRGRRQAGVVLCAGDARLVLRLDADAASGIAAVERVGPARIEGTVPACGLRVGYLTEALARLPEVSWVTLGFSDAEGASPVAIQGPEASGAGCVAVIMPYAVKG